MAFMIRGSGVTDPTLPMESYSVWVKPTWNASWGFVPYLFPENSISCAAPSEESAEIVWDYGWYRSLWNAGAEYLSPLNLQNYYVKIMIHTEFGSYIGWIGVIVGCTMQDEGIDTDTGYPRGVQTLHCKGLEYLLDRRVIIGTYAAQAGGGSAVYLPRTRVFNRRFHQGQTVNGNRSTSPGADGIYMFSEDGELWSNLDILDHILWYHCPNSPQFYVSGQYSLLSNVFQEWDFHGHTAREAIAKLINRKRGIGYRIYTTGVGAVYLHIFSLSQTGFSNSAMTVLPAHVQLDLDISNDPNITMELEITNLTSYDQIVVEARDPIRATGTLSFQAGSLERVGLTQRKQPTRTRAKRTQAGAVLRMSVFIASSGCHVLGYPRAGFLRSMIIP